MLEQIKESFDKSTAGMCQRSKNIVARMFLVLLGERKSEDYRMIIHDIFEVVGELLEKNHHDFKSSGGEDLFILLLHLHQLSDEEGEVLRIFFIKKIPPCDYDLGTYVTNQLSCLRVIKPASVFTSLHLRQSVLRASIFRSGGSSDLTFVSDRPVSDDEIVSCLREYYEGRGFCFSTRGPSVFEAVKGERFDDEGFVNITVSNCSNDSTRLVFITAMER